VDRKYRISFRYLNYVSKHGKWSRPLLVLGSRPRGGTITIRGMHNHTPLMKEQFAINHNIHQGHAVVQLVEALRYKPVGRGFEF